MDINNAQKQREIDLAWAQHKGSDAHIPTEREIWEREEHKQNKGK